MGINPIDAVKMFIQGAQRQNPNLDPAGTARNMLGNPNIQTSSQAWDMMLQTGRIDRATYEKYKGMM